jgi:integrase
MAVLAECPYCHRRQAVKNRQCVGCGQDLIKTKRAKKVRYWIAYRVNGKQRWEYVGLSIEEARAAEGKRKAQKFENPAILEKVPAERMTFNELAAWYLDLPSVKKLASYYRIRQALKAFNKMLGERIISSIKPLDLEAYQHKREQEGRAPATIDMEISIAKTMVTKAFDNDLVDGRTVKAFRKLKRKLRRGANARRRTLSASEYIRLLNIAPPHLRAFLILAVNTGMRLGELRSLKWSHIDRENRCIRLSADLTKENRPKVIPINHHVRRVLAEIPQALHHDFVLTYRGKPIVNVGGVKESFKIACQRAGIEQGRDVAGGLIFHDLRRTVKTNMVNAGVDRVHRDIILGHSLLGMDIHYMAPSEEDLHRAMGVYTEWLNAQIASVSDIVSNDQKRG